MTEAPSRLAIVAAAAASLAITDLLQVASGDKTGGQALDSSTVPQLADALKMTIEHGVAHALLEDCDHEARAELDRLHASLGRFLEYWA